MNPRSAASRGRAGGRYGVGVSLVLPAVLAVGLGLAGCKKPFEPPDNGTPPEVALNARYLDFIVEGYTFTYFSCDPAGCRDDRTNRADLELRWDYEADGVWDTEFESLAYIRNFRPSPLPLPGTDWRIRCEARDGDGMTGTGSAVVPMPADTPRAPDLVARRAVVDTIYDGWTSTDTVRVGQDFHVLLSHIRWLQESDYFTTFVARLLIDGEPDLEWDVHLVSNIRWGIPGWEASQFYGQSVRIDEPGTHTLTVIVDTGGDIAETDETNNSFTRELEVVP